MYLLTACTPIPGYYFDEDNTRHDKFQPMILRLEDFAPKIFPAGRHIAQILPIKCTAVLPDVKHSRNTTDIL